MNDQEVIEEIKKAVAFLTDGTFNADDLAARLKQIIDENNAAGLLHKTRLEKLLFRVKHLMDQQKQYWGGDKSLLASCKTEERELSEFVNRILAQGYSIEAYGKKQEQRNLF